MRRLSVLLAVLAAAVLAASARPSPGTGLQARARLALAEVDRLDRTVERLAEAYDLARVELARTHRSLRANAGALRVARRNLSQMEAALARLLVARYEEREPNSTVAIVVGATSLSSLIDRLDAAERIGEEDARILAQVVAFRARVLAVGRRLRRDEARERLLIETLGLRRRQIGVRLVRRRRVLASIGSEIARLQSQERVRQERLRVEAEARLASRPTAPPSPPVQAGTTSATAPSRPRTADAPAGGHPEVVGIALRYLGVPYQWGGASPSTGFDCSGFVMYVYARIGIALPHNAALQYGYGAPVARDRLQPGDLVFFDGLGHDGIYIGGGQFVDAPKTGDVVKIENLNDPWWSASYVGARRLP